MSNMRIGDKLHAFGFHLLQAAVNNPLLHFKFRDTVTQQATDAVGFFVNRDPVPRAVELLRGSQACWAGTDYRDFFAGAEFRRLGMDQAFSESPLNHALLDLLDGDCGLVDS